MQPLWKTVWTFVKILKVELPYDSTIPLLCVPLKVKHYFEKIYSPLCLLQHYLQKPKYGSILCPSVDEWIKKLRKYTTEYYSAFKNHEILSFATTWMALKGITLSEVKYDTERQILYDFTYMWTLKNEMNKHN